MITFEEAKKIANSLKSVVNECHEYNAAYHFIDKHFDGDGDNGVVVLKENGKAITFIQFIMDYKPERKFKKIPMGKTVKR